jgi:hypothetical protein
MAPLGNPRRLLPETPKQWLVAVVALVFVVAAISNIIDPPPTRSVARTPVPADPASAALLPTQTPPRPPAAATATPTASPYASGGLGLSLADWEAKHGPANNRRRERLYEDDKYGVYYWHSGEVFVTDSSPVIWARRSWPEGQEVSLDEAKAEAVSLIPTDAVLQGSQQKDGLQWWIEIYTSTSLATRYPAPAELTAKQDPWESAAPGTFSIEYFGNGLGDIEAIHIQTGDATKK